MKLKFENPFKVAERENNYFLATLLVCTLIVILSSAIIWFCTIVGTQGLLLIPFITTIYVAYKSISIK